VTPGDDAPALPLGLAHVASCSFLASRLAPSGQFWIALGGGVALARAGQKHGLRGGYGASAAAMVQTVALIGPARFNAPLTQALNAPLLGRLQARGASRAVRLAACLAIRLAHYAVLNVVFVALVVGGLEEYVATYDKIAGFLRILPRGQAAAIWLTIVGALFYGLAFSVIQTLICERALKRWPEDGETPSTPEVRVRAPGSRRVWLAPALTAIAWIVLLAAPRWPVLAGVAAVFAALTLLTRARRAGRTTWTVGLALAAVLMLGALVPALIGAVDLDPAARRAVRAALLVLTATWARAFAGADGLREAARRTLWGARRVPAAAEAARITEQLESDTQLVPAAHALVERLRGVPYRPAPVADALTAWVAAQASGYRPPPSG